MPLLCLKVVERLIGIGVETRVESSTAVAQCPDPTGNEEHVIFRRNLWSTRTARIHSLPN